MGGQPVPRFALIRTVGGWSLLWGAALGWWVLAPAVTASHRLTAGSVAEHAALVLVLSGVFALTGLVAGIVGGSLVVAVRAAAGEFVSPPWAWSVGSLPGLLVGYVALSLLLRAAGLGGYQGETLSRAWWVATAATVGGTTALSLAAYRRVRRLDPRQWLPRMRWALVAVATAGAAVAQAAVPGGAPAPLARAIPSPAIGPDHTRALLVVGIDSLAPRVIDEVRRTRPLPLFDRLAEQGRQAVMHAPWPPYWSSPAWAAILTGSPIEESGLSNDLFVESPGLAAYTLPFDGPILIGPVVALELVLARVRIVRPVPPAAGVLRRPLIWRRLADAGITTAVVRFPFSHPASRQADYTISNRTGRDEFFELGVRPNAGRDLVWPPTLAPYVERFFGETSPVEPQAFEEVLPDAIMREAPRSLLKDDRELVSLGLDIDLRTLAAARQLLDDHQDIRAMFLYLGGFDTACHHLWRYRFPEDFPGERAPTAVERGIGETIDRYLARLDGEIDTLTSRFPVAPTVIVLSDHGHEATTRHPLFSGWHGPDAAFLAGGPGVATAPSRAWARATYQDFIDTVLAVFSAEAGLAGRPGTAR